MTLFIVGAVVGGCIVAYVWYLWNDARAMLLELDRQNDR